MTKVVAIDAVRIGPQGKGIGRALENIAPLLLRLSNDEIRYIALTTAERERHLPTLDRRSIHVVPTMVGSVWEQFGLPYFSRKAGADLIYMLGETGPRWGPRYVLHLTEDPEARWAHDPDAGARERIRRFYERTTVDRSLARAPLLFAISGATAKRMSDRYGTRHIETVHLAVDERFFVEDEPEGVHIFHLGSSDVRDNTKAVAIAYKQLCSRMSDVPPLVIGGELGVLREKVHDILHDLINEGRCALLGRVPDDVLVSLYQQAILCLQPSSHEGFGLQQLEALAAGAPLIASRDDAVSEVVGDAALVVSNPEPSLLSQAMEQLLTHPAERDELRRLARERASGFTWQATTEKIHSSISRFLQDKGQKGGKR